MKTTLEISSLSSDKNLSGPYKDHPIHESSTYEETPTIMAEQDSISEDEDE